MGSGASAAPVEKPSREGLTEEDLTEEEKAHLQQILWKTKEEVMYQINEDRISWIEGEQWKKHAEGRKYSKEEPEKKVLFLSDGVANWVGAARAVHKDVIPLVYPAKEQHTLSDDVVSAFEKAEIPKESIAHFGWMFRGPEMRYELKDSDEKNRKDGNVKFLKALKPYLTQDARVDILACELTSGDVLAGDTGVKVVEELEELTGVKIWGACKDLVGSGATKGNWLMTKEGENVKDTYFVKITKFTDKLVDYEKLRKMQMQARRRQFKG